MIQLQPDYYANLADLQTPTIEVKVQGMYKIPRNQIYSSFFQLKVQTRLTKKLWPPFGNEGTT